MYNCTDPFSMYILCIAAGYHITRTFDNTRLNGNPIQNCQIVTKHCIIYVTHKDSGNADDDIANRDILSIMTLL